MQNFQRPRLIKLLKAVAFLLEKSAEEPATGVEIMRAVGEIGDDVHTLNASKKRAFERLKADLRMVGVPLRTYPWKERTEQGKTRTTTAYSIPRGEYVLRKLDLDQDEQMVLNLLCQVLAQEEGFPLRANLGQAFQKISAVEGTPLQIPLEDQLRAASPETVPAKQDPEVLDKLMLAGCDKNPVSFEYEAFHSQTLRCRKVEPYGFFSRRGIWYLVGREVELDEVRVFRVGRIRSPSSLEVHRTETFSVPDDFNIRDYASVPPWNFHSELEEKDVEVEFDEREFWRVREYCRRYGDVEEIKGKPVRWRLRARDYDALIKWLLPYGASVTPVGPSDFIKRYRELVSETLAHYRG